MLTGLGVGLRLGKAEAMMEATQTTEAATPGPDKVLAGIPTAPGLDEGEEELGASLVGAPGGTGVDAGPSVSSSEL